MVWVPLRRSASSYEQHAESKNGRYRPRDEEPESPITRGAGEELRQAGAQRGRGLHPKNDQHHTNNEQGNPDDTLHPSLLLRSASIIRKEARRLLQLVPSPVIEFGGGRVCMPIASSRDYEFHGHLGALLDPRLDILIDTAFLMNGRDDRPSSG